MVVTVVENRAQNHDNDTRRVKVTTNLFVSYLRAAGSEQLMSLDDIMCDTGAISDAESLTCTFLIMNPAQRQEKWVRMAVVHYFSLRRMPASVEIVAPCACP